MTEAVTVALITGGLSLVGVILTNWATSKKQERAVAVAQAVTDTKLDALTREVREHNNFAQKMPVVQQEITDLKRRVDNLEQYHKAPTK
jgi:hypothetical protein